jgi:hypothetical protein
MSVEEIFSEEERAAYIPPFEVMLPGREPNWLDEFWKDRGPPNVEDIFNFPLIQPVKVEAQFKDGNPSN